MKNPFEKLKEFESRLFGGWKSKYKLPKVQRVYGHTVPAEEVQLQPWVQKIVDDRKNLENNVDRLKELLEE